MLTLMQNILDTAQGTYNRKLTKYIMVYPLSLLYFWPQHSSILHMYFYLLPPSLDHKLCENKGFALPTSVQQNLVHENHLKENCVGNSPAVQWLRLHGFTADSSSSIPSLELRSHKICNE